MSKWSDRQKAIQRYQARREAGLCRNCPSPALPGRTRCEPCRLNAKIYNQGIRDIHKGAARPTPLTTADRKLAAAGRCRCGLLLPCACLPTSAADWRAYAGGPSE